MSDFSDKGLTQEKVDKVRQWGAMGFKKRNMAKALMVTTDTLTKWLRVGKNDYEEGEFTSLKAQLYQAFTDGRAEMEQRALGVITSSPKWDAQAWLLEREFKNDEDNYNKTQSVKQEITNRFEEMSDDELSSKIVDMMGALEMNIETGKEIDEDER